MVEKSALDAVTVCGAGVQGSMIAFRCAVHGKRVALYDLDAAALESALEKSETWLARYAESGRLTTVAARAARRRIVPQTDLAAAVRGVGLVIESVPERLELKQAVWADVDALAAEATLLTTNSSSLRSSEIGAAVGRKDRTFNLNFMTPTEDDQVEVMWNPSTSESTKRAALAFLRSIRCVPIVTRKEIQGFSLNRVWRAIKKESLRLWAEDYIDPEDLDRAFMLEWGTACGPFGLMDKVGLDVVRDIELSYHRETGDASDLPPRALEHMIAAGSLGEKSGRGFYLYPDPAYLRPEWLRGDGGRE